MQTAVIQILAQDPDVTAEQIADRIGCAPVQVKQLTFYKRVVVSRLSRASNPTGELLHSLLD